jgi:hypothetical protein
MECGVWEIDTDIRWENPKKRDFLGDVDSEERIILKFMSKEVECEETE